MIKEDRVLDKMIEVNILPIVSSFLLTGNNNERPSIKEKYQ